MSKALLLTVALAGLAGGACDQRSDPGVATAANTVAPSTTVAVSCTPTDAKLPVTGLCRSQAAALLLAAPGAATPPPEDCSWVVSEAGIADGSALLYRAARCEGGTARLAYVPAKPMARFDLVASPYENVPAEPMPMVWMTRAKDAQAITAIVRQTAPAAERSRCQARPAAMEGWPQDALVVDEVPAPESDGVRTACGELGLDQGAQTFWRVSQGIGWYVQLGQESPMVDAGSLTLVKRDGNGAWIRD